MRSRKSVGNLIGSESKQVVFTSNATSAINQVAHGIDWSEGDVIVTTDREHNSNLVPWKQMVAKHGVVHRTFSRAEDGSFDFEALEDVCTESGSNLRLVSIPHVSNLDGVSAPVKEVSRVAHDFGAEVLVDAAQSVPHKAIDVEDLGCDYLAFSLHKMLGPSGVGVLWGKEQALASLETISGGGMTVRSVSDDSVEFRPIPDRLEGGLANFAGIAGAGAATDYLSELNMVEVEEHESRLNRIIHEGVMGVDGVEIIGPSDPSQRGGITSLQIEGIDPHVVAVMLDEAASVFVRSGYHCVDSWFQSQSESHLGSLRVSPYLYNTEEEVRQFVDTFEEIVSVL